MKVHWIAAPLAAVVVTAVLVVALGTPATAVRPGEAVRLLDSAPDGSAPTLAYIENFDLQASTVRFAGSTESQRFWVGIDSAGKVCIVTTAGTPETGGAACAPADVVKSSGVMMVLTPDRASGLSEFAVYLLPDVADAAKVSGPWQAVGGNVVVADADAARSAITVKVPRSDGGEIALVV